MRRLGRAGAALGVVLALGAVCAGDAGDAAGTASPIASAARAGFAPGAPGVGDRYFPDAGNGGYDVQHYDLQLRYDPDSGQLDGHAVITAVATQNLSRFDLDFGRLAISTLTVNGTRATWVKAGQELVITPAAGLRDGRRFSVDVRYAGQPGVGPEATEVDSGFIRSRTGAVAVDEPTGAADWYPANDHPRDKASYTFAITVPAGVTAVANGVLVGSAAAPGNQTTWRWREDAPMASYLATVAIGRYRIQTGPGNLFVAVADSLPQAKVDAVVARTPEVVEFLAGTFGPFPFDGLGGIVPAEPRLRLALETQTRPVYAPGFFDRDSVTSILAHELTHQWFGDSVSLHDWRDIWLNEGFATYGQWMWDEHTGRGSLPDHFAEYYAKTDIWDPPPGDPGPEKLFAPSVYVRGAMTLQALRMTVGDETFFRILRAWADGHRYSTATIAEFIDLAARFGGGSVRGLLNTWLYSPGRPPRP
jgi:aminopeptidase N